MSQERNLSQNAIARAPAAPRRKPVFFLTVSGPCRFAKVSGRDYGRTRELSWYTDGNGYPAARQRKRAGGDGRKIHLHVLVLGRKEGCVIDHLDGDKRNCTRDNLRHVPVGANAANRVAQQGSTSGVRGVHSVGGRWSVQFMVGHKVLSLGRQKDLAPATRIATLAVPLIYGRGVRLADGSTFDESQLAPLAAVAAEIARPDLWRLLARTAETGDDLSAALRRKIVLRLV